MKSLQHQNHRLSDPKVQMELLDDCNSLGIEPFRHKLENIGLYPLRPTGIETLQVNVGKMCNQVCRHCHVDAGPDRKEIMTRETMILCLNALLNTNIQAVDITGGAPEMNPDFRWFVEELTSMGKRVIVRCNLTIILANPKYHDLPEFFKKHRINVVSSLPYFAASRTDAQRGEGVFAKSIEALRRLNEVGYGIREGLRLDLVYNPSGAFLPGSQSDLEQEFKHKLFDRFGISFNSLFSITNLPISRFLEYLIQSENYESYMTDLVNAYNPAAAAGVMCRNTLSVGWDGSLYDCDFNQMLELKVINVPDHIRDFDPKALNDRSIRIGQHCYGCTAGAGSSCGGSIA